VGAQNTTGLENFEIFDRNRRLSWKWFLYNVNRKSYALYE